MCTFIYWRRRRSQCGLPFCHQSCPLSPASVGHHHPCCTVTLFWGVVGKGGGADLSHTAMAHKPPAASQAEVFLSPLSCIRAGHRRVTGAHRHMNPAIFS